MKLTHSQKRQMFEVGYAVLPGVIPQAMVREARKAINHCLASSFK